MTQNISLTQKAIQTTVLTPQQIQSMKILQSTAQELEVQIREEMLQNPVIELTNPMEVLAGNPLEDCNAKASNDKDGNNYDNDRAAEIAERDENLADSAWDSFGSDEPFDEQASSNWTSSSEDKRRHFFNSLSSDKSLPEILLEQLNEAVPDDSSPLYKACREILYNLVSNGYLDASDEEIAKGAGVTLETAVQAVKIVQSFSPPGIGAHDLREALLLQLERNNEKGSLAWEIADKYLLELSQNKIPQIAKTLDADIDEIQTAFARIKKLDPKPGHAVASTRAPIIIPDIIISRGRDGEWKATPNTDAFPSVTISKEYEEIQKDKSLNQEFKAFLDEKIKTAKQLIHNLDYRKSTIERIADALIIFQHDFFENGESALKPLVMSTVADSLDLHETTISRAIANKYVRTPYGVFSFKHFFTTGYGDLDGQSVSSRAVIIKITELVNAEDKSKPLSDQKISEILSKDGLDVARRTVAKYRDLEGIPAASLRKIHS